MKRRSVRLLWLSLAMLGLAACGRRTPDAFVVEAPGTNLAKTWSFSNCPGTIQSYPDAFGVAQNAPKTGAIDTQSLGLGSGAECGDAKVRGCFERRRSRGEV